MPIRLPADANRGQDNETAIEDLKVLESQEVFDDEVGYEDNTGEAVDDKVVESIEDLSMELVELIEKHFEKPRGRTKSSASQDFHCNFVWERLEKLTALPPIELKDFL
ncbi:hypothetical protein BGZ83_009634 [Gryganskiella cystojenkinii]|nr:hypothetical protein BGZ83_009634 [Gryganskiella cystojenkinii]